MHNYIAVIHDDPAFARFALFFAFFAVLRTDGIQRAFGQRIQHAVTGAVTDDKIIGKGRDFFDVEQKDVFAFFIFERVDNGMS